MEPLVSVIIPTYNSGPYITEALMSVFGQTYKNFEIIVVDDGSTDETKNNLHSFINGVQCIYKDNAGPASARNLGIKKSKGEYIAFLDSDDIWLPEKLKLQLGLFSMLPEIELAHSDFTYFDDRGLEKKSEYSEIDKKNFGGNVFYYLVRENFVRTSSVVVKKETLKRVKLFDEELFMSEDYDLWLRITKEKRLVGYINKPLLKVRRHSNSVTEDAKKTYLWVNKAVNKTIESSPELKEKINQHLSYRHAKTCFTKGYTLFSQGKLKEARKQLLQSLQHRVLTRSLVYFILCFLPNPVINLLKLAKGYRNS